MTHLEEIRKLYTTRRKQAVGISVSGPNIFFVLFSIYCSVKQQSCISWKRDKAQDRFSIRWLTLQCITCWDETDQSRGPGTQSESTARLPQARALEASLCAGNGKLSWNSNPSRQQNTGWSILSRILVTELNIHPLSDSWWYIKCRFHLKYAFADHKLSTPVLILPKEVRKEYLYPRTLLITKSLVKKNNNIKKVS